MFENLVFPSSKIKEKCHQRVRKGGTGGAKSTQLTDSRPTHIYADSSRRREHSNL